LRRTFSARPGPPGQLTGCYFHCAGSNCRGTQFFCQIVMDMLGAGMEKMSFQANARSKCVKFLNRIRGKMTIALAATGFFEDGRVNINRHGVATT
jgi:hypothetical protein